MKIGLYWGGRQKTVVNKKLSDFFSGITGVGSKMMLNGWGGKRYSVEITNLPINGGIEFKLLEIKDASQTNA